MWHLAKCPNVLGYKPKILCIFGPMGHLPQYWSTAPIFRGAKHSAQAENLLGKFPFRQLGCNEGWRILYITQYPVNILFFLTSFIGNPFHMIIISKIRQNWKPQYSVSLLPCNWRMICKTTHVEIFFCTEILDQNKYKLSS